MNLFEEKCPRCDGKGEVDVRSFSDPTKSLFVSCSVCKGKKVLPPDWEKVAKHLEKERDAYKWAYGYLQDRMKSLGREGWAHDCDGEIEDRCKP